MARGGEGLVSTGSLRKEDQQLRASSYVVPVT